jgi:hypothetical protein
MFSRGWLFALTELDGTSFCKVRRATCPGDAVLLVFPGDPALLALFGEVDFLIFLDDAFLLVLPGDVARLGDPGDPACLGNSGDAVRFAFPDGDAARLVDPGLAGCFVCLDKSLDVDGPGWYGCLGGPG